MMTFEQFQATGRDCDDLGEALFDARWEHEAPAKGRLYLDCLYIERCQSEDGEWPNGEVGLWSLQIANEGWLDDELENLERHLYNYALLEVLDD